MRTWKILIQKFKFKCYAFFAKTVSLVFITFRMNQVIGANLVFTLAKCWFLLTLWVKKDESRETFLTESQLTKTHFVSTVNLYTENMLAQCIRRRMLLIYMPKINYKDRKRISLVKLDNNIKLVEILNPGTLHIHILIYLWAST